LKYAVIHLTAPYLILTDMKRANLVILMALLVGISMTQPAFSSGKEDFVIKKGKVIDFYHDGVWDVLYFTLKQNDPTLEIPVKSIKIFGCEVDFKFVKFNKKKTLYFVDLTGFDKLTGKTLSGSFSTEIVVDTSNLPYFGSDDSSDIDSNYPFTGKPGEAGTVPPETVIIIDYP